MGIPEGKCLAGFSGGADSTALLYRLAAERDAGRTEPVAVHVNHGLRGAEADGDEAFCRETCGKLGIPLLVRRAELHGRTDENACREARFRCFREAAEETGIRTLVLAHNRDDAAETFLMRLMRGAGPEGLGGMSAEDEREGLRIFRPMLEKGREEIRRELREAGIGWREDSTNDSDAYLRNRIRRQLIPRMEEMAPGAAERIARTAAMIRNENRILEAEADAFLARNASGIRMDAEELRRMPEALQARIVRSWWRKCGAAAETKERCLNARQTAALTALAAADRGRENLPGGWTAVRARHGLYLTGPGKPERTEIPYGAAEMRMNGICLRTAESRGEPGDGVTAQEMPAEMLEGCVLRTRKAGDRIRPFGMEGHRKLQDYLTDRGIDEPWRDRIPMLCRGGEVILAAGVGAGAVPRWNAARKNVRLEWTGEMPWRIRGGQEEKEHGTER